MTPIRMAQFGTLHGHAAGKLKAMLDNPDVEFVGLFERDPNQRRELERQSGIWSQIKWLDSAEEVLEDPSVVAVANEDPNNESLERSIPIVEAGKHLWLDKPAGNWLDGWHALARTAQEKNLHVQMGYMFRYHAGFQKIGEWVEDGLLGPVFSVRAHMSTWLTAEQRSVIGLYRGGIFYDLAGHMIDQIISLLGPPRECTGFFDNSDFNTAQLVDNSLGVLRYYDAIAFIDIAAMEPKPMARRFEVYGLDGSAILEPFEPAGPIRLTLREAAGGYDAGEQRVGVPVQSRQRLYELELESFIATVRGEKEPDRSFEHDTHVQETLMRIVEQDPAQ